MLNNHSNDRTMRNTLQSEIPRQSLTTQHHRWLLGRVEQGIVVHSPLAFPNSAMRQACRPFRHMAVK